MKKNINVFVLLLICLFSLSLFGNVKADSLSYDEGVSLKNMLTKYYDEGYYQKDTVINLNEVAMNEAAKYFHVETHLERTTLFDGNELFMTNSNGSINSGYGTDSNGDMVHFTKDENGLKVVDYTVTMPNSGGMEEYYYTLKDLLELDYKEWNYSNGVYTYQPANSDNNDVWFTIFRDITAPCFLNGADNSKNYVSFSKITIEEVSNRLLLKLYVDQGDYSKLTPQHQSDLCFSQATILGGHLVDLGTVGGDSVPLYEVNLIRTIDSIVLEATTDVELTSNGLDKIEIFVNFDKFYDINGNGASTRNSQTVLFNIFSSGLIRAWNWPNNTKSADNALFKFGNNKVTSGDVAITNTVTLSNSNLNKMYFEVPYSFFNKLYEQEVGLDSVAGNSTINQTSPIGIYFMAGRKVGSSWVNKDNWSCKTLLDSNKGNPSELLIIGHDNKLYKNYYRYTLDILSSFERLNSYVTTVYGKGLEDNMASFSGHEIKNYLPGTYLFSNRTTHSVPADGGVGALKGLTYIYDKVDGNNTNITATKSGYLLIAMDDNNIKNALASNWNFVAKSRLTNSGVSLGKNTMSLYIVWVEEGQVVTVPANALVFTK